MSTTRPIHMRFHRISEPGPPAAPNQAFRRWMRQKRRGQIASRYQARPAMGARREKAGIAAHDAREARGGVEKSSAAPQLERRQRIIRQTLEKRSSKPVPGP